MKDANHYYHVLGLEPGASLEEINQAYKDLAFIWHPDRIPQDNDRLYKKAQEKLKEINQARDFLRSSQRSNKTTAKRTPQQQTTTARSHAARNHNQDYHRQERASSRPPKQEREPSSTRTHEPPRTSEPRNRAHPVSYTHLTLPTKA
jgi:DnaJ-class molecular chaperone